VAPAVGVLAARARAVAGTTARRLERAAAGLTGDLARALLLAPGADSSVRRRVFSEYVHCRRKLTWVLTQMRLRWSGPFRSEPADHDAVARAAFNAAVHHSRSSIMVLAAPSSSVSPASTSPPWKCAQSVATGI
jgi:hypothetical protein